MIRDLVFEQKKIPVFCQNFQILFVFPDTEILPESLTHNVKHS